MLDVRSFLEHNRPIWVIMTHWRIDIEATRQLCIDSYLVALFQVLGKVHLNASRINYHQIIK